MIVAAILLGILIGLFIALGLILVFFRHGIWRS
jgi:hypothetical protein